MHKKPGTDLGGCKRGVHKRCSDLEGCPSGAKLRGCQPSTSTVGLGEDVQVGDIPQ